MSGTELDQAGWERANEARRVLGGRVLVVNYEGAGEVSIRLTVEQLDCLLAREQHLVLLTGDESD